MRIVLSLIVFPLALFAADWPGMLVSTDWLARNLGRQELVLLHVGAASDYAEGHIPGARLIELTDVSVAGPDGLHVELPPVDQLAHTFRRLGVTDRSHVVLYAGGVSFQTATRVFFTLDYLGFGNRTALLDGGLAAWRAEGRPLSRDPEPEARPGDFTPRPAPERVVDARWLQSQAASARCVLLDARAPEFFSGAKVGTASRAGHIPGARNLPMTTLLDPATGKLKSRQELAGILNAAGVRPGAPVVSYCHVGMQATALYFAARYLGFDARLYDGSLEDWSRRPELPVAAPAAEAGPIR